MGQMSKCGLKLWLEYHLIRVLEPESKVLLNWYAFLRNDSIKTIFGLQRPWQRICKETYFSTVYIPDGIYSKIWSNQLSQSSRSDGVLRIIQRFFSLANFPKITPVIPSYLDKVCEDKFYSVLASLPVLYARPVWCLTAFLLSVNYKVR